MNMVAPENQPKEATIGGAVVYNQKVFRNRFFFFQHRWNSERGGGGFWMEFAKHWLGEIPYQLGKFYGK